MESSWHHNVWEQGLGCTGATLCARYLIGAGYYITNGTENGGDDYMTIWVVPSPFGTPGSVFPYASTIMLKRDFAKHTFPYGLNVIPDVPL